MDNESHAINNQSVATIKSVAINKSAANNNENVANNNKSDATNKSVANNNQNAANNNQSAANNKGAATTCCGSGINEFGAINGYGANNNKSGRTCCCGCVSIETGTYVAAIVSWVSYMMSAIFFFFGPKHLLFGMFNIGFACPCLLVIFAQQARNPWLFVPYLIAGVVDVIIRWLICFEFLNLCSASNFNLCTIVVVLIVVTIVFHSWFYSIIVRGFLAAREVESRRYRPHF